MNKFVSIVIPCRNEENFIENCINSLLNQTYPKEWMEIIAVDGFSEDRTRRIIKIYSGKYSFVKILDNPKKYNPFALNIGINNSKGDIIMVASGHARYENDFIEKCVGFIQEKNVDGAGGIVKNLPQKKTFFSKAIALCLSSFFGAGTAFFRTGSKKIREVDAFFGGCYKKEAFSKAGLFNEKLIRSQDIEFNKRLKKAGGKLFLIPDAVTYYYYRSSLIGFLKHNFLDGTWLTYPLKFRIKVFSFRHLLPLFFVAALISTIIFSFIFWWGKFLLVLLFGSYILANLFFSIKIALKEGFRYVFLMPITFSARHLAYGFGSLWGFIKIIIKK
jgi:glycosyltransferase involved in cell wall biosynthesis